MPPSGLHLGPTPGTPASPDDVALEPTAPATTWRGHRFASAEVEEAYWSERVDGNRRYLRAIAACGFGFVAVALAGNEIGVSWPILPESEKIIVRGWAAAELVLSALLFVATYAVRSWRGFSRLAFTLFAAMLATHELAYFTTDRASSLGYLVGLLIISLTVVGLTRMRFPASAILGGATLAAFVGGTAAVGDFAYDGRGGAIMYVAMAAGLAVLVAMQSDRMTRQAYAARVVEETRRRQVVRLAEELRDAHAKSEALLLNVLPAPIAARLKARPEIIADSFDEATVLFADIAGFTTMSARIGAHELVRFLNEVFSSFDAIVARHGLEKIKTIGDAYMAAAGIPEAREDHAEAVMMAAIEMREAIGRLDAPGGAVLRMRIGIHSGPVVAGVIGSAKWAYDLWGDTVNTASRMESHGEPGEIQVTDRTRELLQERHAFIDRGVIEIKGKGAMRAWLWSARKAR